jgi:hypothetical protein
MAVALPGLSVVQWPGFGGLNLRDQPNQIDPTQALDLLNVTLIERGGVKSRDGYAKFTSPVLTNRADSMAAFYTVSGTTQLVVGNGLRLDALNTAGTSVASSGAPTASPHYFARFGGPTAELMFISNGTDAVRSYNGAAFAAPAWAGTVPTGKFLAVTPWDNRLVNARRSGTTGGDNPSTVRFSDPGVPTTFGANNFIDLLPGDGEQIMGVIAWSRYVFVFKETKFFRFYGTTTAAGGTPVFNYETVDTGIGLAAPRAVCAGRDGVYFLSRTGVYRTQGTNVELVSSLLDPFFYNTTSGFYTGGALNMSQIGVSAMAFNREQIHVAVPTGSSTTNNRLLVYDPRYQWWSLYDIPASAMAGFRVSAQPDLMFGYAAGTFDVGRHTSGQTTDAGTTIASRWRSGWWDMGDPHSKTIREQLAWGKGRLRFGFRTDFGGNLNVSAVDFAAGTDVWSDGTNAADKWASGSDPSDKWAEGRILTPKLNRQAARGTVFSLDLANSDATAWALYRLAARLRPIESNRPY